MTLDIRKQLQEKCFKAFLDLVLLRILAKQCMTGYQINNILMRRYHIFLAPGVIYTKLNSMERKELIDCISSNQRRVYVITKKGKDILDDLPAIESEIKDFIGLILNF